MNIKEIFKSISLTGFLEEIDNQDFFWIVKRLSGNDTGLTGGHQVGVYYPKVFFEKIFPGIYTRKILNPHTEISECYFPDMDYSIKSLNVVYYNNKFFKKDPRNGRNEFRITRWGGSSSPVQNVENTGSIFLFALKAVEDKIQAVGWIPETVKEEELIEDWIGSEVEPGRFIMKDAGTDKVRDRKFEIPEEWFVQFPSGKQIFEFVVKMIPQTGSKETLDKLLLKRRELEFEIFQEIEQKNAMPVIREGFKSIEDFLKLAHSVANRRKSRTGLSLELNLESIFKNQKLLFETQVITENKKKPDFLFPSRKAYLDTNYSSSMLHMMAAKTCCKDRWRQVINEADRIYPKHLFTLQQGISDNQLKEMKDNNIELVVPEPYLSSFSKNWRESILTLEGFVNYIKDEQAGIKNLKEWIS